MPLFAKLASPSPDEDFDEEDKEGDRDLMEEALTYLNQSQKLWEKGDIEKALDFLDPAYTLVLETDGDLEIARQKDDLRLLISKRILAIYSSIQSTTLGKRSEIPLAMNSDVEREIRSFQTCEKDFFVSSYQRSGIYRDNIVKELKKAVCRRSYLGCLLLKEDLKSVHYRELVLLASGNSFRLPGINLV